MSVHVVQVCGGTAITVCCPRLCACESFGKFVKWHVRLYFNQNKVVTYLAFIHAIRSFVRSFVFSFLFYLYY